MVPSQSNVRPWALLVAVVALAPCAALAQTPLGTPTAAFPEDFGTIQTIRELPDGRVLVADPLSNALYAVDFDAGTRVVIGREGEGPEEYMQPDAVWPLPDGSSLLVDLGNARLTILDANLEFIETMPIASGDPRPGGDSPLVLAVPRGVDAEGNIYAQAMSMGFGGAMPDSGAVLRINRRTQDIDTVARFKMEERRRSESGGANNRNVQISPIPLSTQDAWGVAADGSVVLARAGDYHIDWVSPDGSVRSGPPQPFESVRIGTAEKEEYVAGQGRTGGGVGIRVEINNDEMQMTFSRGGGAGGPREIDSYDWPARKPPVYSGRLSVDLLNRVWVRKHVDAGEPSTYDVFDDTGALEGTFTLENGKRIIGFGNGAVYVVAYDEFDLNYLERYALPAT